MKVEAVKTIKLDYTVEECNALDEVVNLLNTLVDAMDKEKCDTISGNYYEDVIDISYEELQNALRAIENIKYTTEMF